MSLLEYINVREYRRKIQKKLSI